MSPTLITLAILAGLAIGAYAYFADNWQFWKSSNSVPIHWGFVQSWARGWKGRRHQVNFTKNATVDAGLQAKEWERIKREGFEPPRKTTNDPEKLAADLSKEGWITSLSGTADGFKVITRGAEVAYVQFEVWEKMVASNNEEIIERMRQHGDGLGNAVIGEKGKETITVRGSTLCIPPGSGVIDWSKIPPASSSHNFRERTQVTEHSFCEKKGSGCTLNYCDDNGCNERKRTYTQVTEANEVPEVTKEQMGNAFDYDFSDDKHVLITYRNKDSRRSRSFLPSVNPLGDTAAYMERARPFGDYHDMPRLYNSSFRHISPRHKKGGSRG